MQILLSSLVTIAAVLFSLPAWSIVKSNVVVSYSGIELLLNASGASWASQVNIAEIYQCTDTKTCSLIRTETSPLTIRIAQTGLFKVVYKSPVKKGYFGSYIVASNLWSQYFVNFQQSEETLTSAAIKYAPKFSFHKSEGFFPVSIKQLFDRPLSDIQDLKVTDGSNPKATDPNETIASFMGKNGHLSNQLMLKKSVAKTIPSDKNDFPVYWMAEQSGLSAWVTYFVLYAYDQKKPDYFSTSAAKAVASNGDHAIDRESISIKFIKVSGQWVPASVQYSGHLDTQPVNFLGCANNNCDQAGGISNVRWTSGKTAVLWDNVSKYFNNPIVYVADGSHAMYPGFGFYKLEVSPSFLSPTEPAGSEVTSQLKTGKLEKLDLNSTDHRALTYSGFLIQGAADIYRVFPFERYPIASWYGGTNSIFNDCVANNLGCEKYVNLAANNAAPVTPTVVAVTNPASAVVGQSGTFTVLGGNLPTTAILEVSGGAICQTPTNRTSDSFNQTCTFGTATGSQTITIRIASGGSVISSAFTVSVISALIAPAQQTWTSGGLTLTGPSTRTQGVPVTFAVSFPGITGLTVSASGCSMGGAGGAIVSIIDGFACTPTISSGPMSFTFRNNDPFNPQFGQVIATIGVLVGSTSSVTIPSPSFSLDFTASAINSASGTGSGYSLITGTGGRPAAKFSGAGTIRIPNRAAIQFSTGATFDFWARIDSNTGMDGYGNYATSAWAMTLIGKSHDTNGVLFNAYPPDASFTGNNGYGLSLFSTYDTSYTDPSCTTYTKRHPGKTLGQWYRVTGVLSSTAGIRVYADKELVYQCLASRVNFTQANTQDLYVGLGSSSYWYPLNGAIQDLRVYQSALTDAQVQALP
jgi:Concanavalin A-like lectin/glucanases superfamily